MVSRRSSQARGALTAVVATLALALAGSGTALAASPIGEGTFDDGPEGWVAYGTDGPLDTSTGALCVAVPAGSAQYGVGVVLNGVAIEEGTTYTLRYTATASTDVTVRALVGQNGAPYGTVLDTSPALTSEPRQVTETFTASATYPATPAADDPEGQIAFQLGGFSADAWTFCLDDVALDSEVELLPHTSFAESLGPWSLYGTSEPVFADGRMCVDLPGGQGNPWDAGLVYNGVPVGEGESYVLSFTASATPDMPVRVLVGEGGGAYRTAFEQGSAPLTGEPATREYAFTSNLTFPPDGDAPGQVAFHLGKAGAYEFCISQVSLTTSATPPPGYEPDTGPRVRVNQVGYLPFGPKRATLVTDAAEPVAWELRDADGVVVADGTSEPRGVEPSAAQAVHVLDFSDVTTQGAGYTLVADGETSRPFDIDGDLYQQLRYDALNYFYLARSGTEIEADVVGEEYAREAGHVGVAPNQGDTDVPCIGPRDYYDGWTCDYRLDVSGGWYDAGDHGKYVVNGGIAVGQLLQTYERALHAGTADALADGTLDVPEHGNDVPDVLDEARWELEWMLSMIVPEGEYAGMVHHKVHDEGWTGLPLLPADDPQARSLHRPSTAATLNLSAVAAQGARLLEPYDPQLAQTLLEAARTTWAAAQEHPALYAPGEAGADGGGAYNDSQVADEFYWAAAELYLTTGEDAFATAVTTSPLHTADVFTADGFGWGSVAALGRLDLATVPNELPGLDAVQSSVVEGAQEYLAAQAGQGFGSLYSPPGGEYVWGSSSQVANNLVVVATAYDLTGDERFRAATLEGLDYLFGRNALNQSYVTGWGEVASHQQHSRWFAHQLDPSLPSPPPGSLAGGPNSQAATWDPTTKAAFPDGCAPSACYVDEIQAWSTNELTVNWNSALSWVASWVADQGSAEPVPTAPVVTRQPVDATVALGADATFTAEASGVPAPTVRWQVRAGRGWKDVAGATGTTLTVRATARTDGTRYRAVFTNAAGSVESAVVRLTVERAAPVVTQHPADVRARVGTRAVFRAAADGYPTPCVVWQVRWGGGSWRPIPWATSTTLSVPVTVLAAGTEYRAVFTNAVGTAATEPAELAVQRPRS
ncbi:glycoside hydrolase family 9 protein [Cellulomonas fimi]|uniref:Endoglucanase C n=1 Tax=Cellulomonas fimi (strain ATCC 484 / DSM 20113 / JCM 1341 / CCUG 24087 / LMG 16345 / NBRC 15513 / NCIMB 8980 / NCTC 7547 / NRS-133) TaxID=590998 RepID=GUNC_CELFA|nr:glycoside hydrolase family 9 protein [Cellulomonas fimi]P14090.2 RecName: Full=Endoglucanase C; AltName: Full=Cellulase C; AltName: Full=Endo-1,4-beta-glucanase C; Flags: Precursor [Cellulomonas fimi ATCC 484]AEE45671.1 glycoside hydrolase family 9 [Cellulomonas fimi ATCC 484]NNH07412.1 endoglucanase [Cellulomonas fimi]CAA40993.1 endoglucanase CenC [Cellulomonas fimi ATCC 484]VEH30244.1 Endoglucanase C precursor [Cellulomonas fimi]